MILPLALLVHLSAVCAPQVASATLAAIARVESGLDPLAISDNTTHRLLRPVNKSSAIALAQRLIAAGDSVDLGLMQINRANLGWLGLTLDEAFDPCDSLRAGAAVLTAISRYITGSPTQGFRNGYVARVIAAGHSGVPATSSPVTLPPSWLVFGTDSPKASSSQSWNVFPPSVGPARLADSSLPADTSTGDSDGQSQ
jgi:type IV secretion system protein VirB1